MDGLRWAKDSLSRLPNFGAGVVFVQQSTDGGLTYGPATVVGTMSQTGSLDVDQVDGTGLYQWQ